ncbi:MAG: BtrH N-terminal domain-containing protein [Symbiobacteriia bacterium]
MAPVLLPDFMHRPGKHCGSTALTNAAAYRGLSLSEGACFGLGGGLAFAYRHLPMPPYRAAMGRSPDLEEQFFSNLGQPLEWHSGPELDLPALLQAVDEGNPVLIRLDLAYVDFYQTKSHFAGHVALVVGYDAATRDVFLSDTDRPGLQVASWDSLKQSMASTYPFPIPIQNHWAVIPSLDQRLDLASACRRGLRLVLQNALEPPQVGMGLSALAAFAREVPGWWREVEDASWTYRFAYQAFERRGTGGGNFRRLFGEFLRFAAEQCPEANLGDEEARWLAVADHWTDLANVLKTVSEAGAGAPPDPSLLAAAGARATELVVLEGRLLQDLARRHGTASGPL